MRRTRFKLGLLVVVAVSLSAVAGTLTGRRYFRPAQPAPPQPEQPALSVDAASPDFGDALETEQFLWSLVIRNLGSVDRVVESLDGSCACLSVSPRAFSLAPGQSLRVDLKLHLSNRCTSESENFSVTLWPKIQGRSEMPNWVLRGRVRTVLRPEVNVLQLGNESIRQPQIERTVKIAGLPGIERIECAAGAHWAALVTKDSPGLFVLTLRARLPFQPRQISDTIRLKAFDAADQALPERALSITGEFVRDVVPYPRAAYFGSLGVGEAKEEEVRFSSLTGRGFRIVGVRNTSADLPIGVSCRGTEGSDLRYVVRLAADRAGECATALDFQVEEADGTNYVVTVPVRYLGRSQRSRPEEPAGAHRSAQ